MSDAEPTPADDSTVHGELVETSADGEERREAVEEPAKLMRIGSMIKQLLEEVRSADLDEAARVRLREIYETSLHELGSALSDDLKEELDRVAIPFGDNGEPPSEAELRIAQAQLVGWLEGLFHGIQATLFAQQMAARAQLEDMRRQLGPGVGGGQGGPSPSGVPGGRPGTLGEPGPGTYL
ncbi:bacterial proteasome activator family protein [Iamia sp. SCSIO 61187]|uniref:bacterial proteasome activator family protein n=1 Tax=Iamia sp. SCSIO 61187 TaxID=2722752 RepID=UPI001C62B1CD|nr:bacterial proteasome activator family protein [Iamia sp. SCSIO 61187]QYG92816.1 bacterial proteasome activator family protein [Iamia sp. SCSIO 61187]